MKILYLTIFFAVLCCIGLVQADHALLADLLDCKKTSC